MLYFSDKQKNFKYFFEKKNWAHTRWSLIYIYPFHPIYLILNEKILTYKAFKILISFWIFFTQLWHLNAQGHCEITNLFKLILFSHIKNLFSILYPPKRATPRGAAIVGGVERMELTHHNTTGKQIWNKHDQQYTQPHLWHYFLT